MSLKTGYSKRISARGSHIAVRAILTPGLNLQRLCLRKDCKPTQNRKVSGREFRGNTEWLEWWKEEFLKVELSIVILANARVESGGYQIPES
jgi:hypothetical protein